MSDASLPLQQALIAALKADAGVAALVGARVFDSVPASAPKPYLSWGPEQVLPERAEDYDGADTTIQIDGWSAERGRPEIKRIGRAIAAALDGQELALGDGQRLVALTVERTDYLVEPDGLTHHVAVTLRARTEPSD